MENDIKSQQQITKTTCSFGQKNEKTDLADYFDNRTISGKQIIAEDNERKAEILRLEAKNLNSALVNHNYPEIGDLFKGDLFDIESTLKCLTALLQQRYKDIENRSEALDKIHKLESEKKGLTENIERIANSKKKLQDELLDLKSQFKFVEKQNKENLDKANTEIENMKKNVFKIQGRENQFQTELRKKDSDLKKMQDQIKKIKENSFTYKNSMEITNALIQTGPNLFANNGDYEFTQMMIKGYEEMHVKLLKENEFLRESLIHCNEELEEILNTRKEYIIKRGKIENNESQDINEISNLSLLSMKKEVLIMPLETNGKDAIEVLNENIKKFREFMTKMDLMSKDFDDYSENNEIDEKIKPVKNLKDLLKNYKCVIEAQDSIINKTILKANNMKENKENLDKNIKKEKIIDDKDIENARKFLVEQKNYLDQKNKEMEITKNLIQQTTKKLDEEKLLIAQKRQEIDEEINKNKENFQEIVDKYMDFLNEVLPIDANESTNN